MSDSAASAGCQTLTSLKVPDVYVPYDERLGHGTIPEIQFSEPSKFTHSAPAFAQVDSLPAAGAANLNGTELTVYSADRVSTKQAVSIPDLLAAGAYVLSVAPGGDGTLIAAMKDAVPAKIVDVEVGDSDGVMTWDDPDESGMRPHRVTWDRGAFTYVLVGNYDAAAVVNAARSLMC
jgi:hypothetical protein